MALRDEEVREVFNHYKSKISLDLKACGDVGHEGAWVPKHGAKKKILQLMWTTCGQTPPTWLSQGKSPEARQPREKEQTQAGILARRGPVGLRQVQVGVAQ